MKIDIKESAGKTTVSLEGMLDTNSSPEFQKAVESILEKDGLDILVDLSKMEYISSQGIRTVLTLIKAVMSRQGKLEFSGVRPAVKEILDISGLSEAMVFV